MCSSDLQDRYNDRMDPEFLDPLPTRSPKFFYLRYQPSPRFPPEELDGEGGRGGRPRPLFRPTPRNFPDPFDTVAFTMDRLKGTTLTFHNPTEFAGALEKLSKLLEAK